MLPEAGREPERNEGKMVGKSGKIKKQCFCVIFFISLIFTVNAAFGSSDLQSYCDEKEWFAYIPDVREEGLPVTVQVENEAVFSAQTISASDTIGTGIHTVLLFDNSFSISEQNREAMKAAAAQIIAAHVEGETYTIATFDDSLHILAQESCDYENLQQLIMNIGYANQLTFLTDAIYAAYLRYAYAGRKYMRFVVMTDGCDDDRLGCTYAELLELFKESRYPVYAVGSWYEADTQGLKELFSFSRSTGGAYFLLDEMADTETVSRKLYEDAPVMLVDGVMPETVQDGEIKNIKITVEKPEEDMVFFVRSQMPYPDMQMPEEESFEKDAQNSSGEDDLSAQAKLFGGEGNADSDNPERWSEGEAGDPAAFTGQAAVQTTGEYADLFTEQSAVPSTDQTAVPSTDQTADLFMDQSASLFTDQTAVPSTDQTGSALQEQSFLEQESLIAGVKNMYVCASCAAAAGMLVVFLVRRRKKCTQNKMEGLPDDSEEDDAGYAFAQDQRDVRNIFAQTRAEGSREAGNKSAQTRAGGSREAGNKSAQTRAEDSRAAGYKSAQTCTAGNQEAGYSFDKDQNAGNTGTGRRPAGQIFAGAQSSCANDFTGSEGATVILKKYPGPKVIRWSDKAE